MWQYEKRLEYPVNIKQTDPKTAQYILSQYGGPDGEINASLRYLSQRYSIPYREVAGLLTDIATEEIAHFEMIATIVHQLTRDLTPEEIKASNFGPYYIDHTLAVWPQAAGGVPQKRMCLGTFSRRGAVASATIYPCAECASSRSVFDLFDCFLWFPFSSKKFYQCYAHRPLLS